MPEKLTHEEADKKIMEALEGKDIKQVGKNLLKGLLERPRMEVPITPAPPETPPAEGI